MNLYTVFLSSLLFVQWFPAFSQDSNLLRHANSLAEAEQEFANTAVSKTIKIAFKEVLAHDAIVFRPHPVSARWAYRIDARPDSTYLFWKPELVSISQGGDFGYSTGPWYGKRSKRYGEVKGFGNFVTLWRKDSSGKWRVILDKGVNYSKVGERKVSLKKIVPAQKMSGAVIEVDSIMAIDSKLFGGREEKSFNGETLIFRHDQWPAEFTKKDLEEMTKYAVWEPINGGVAPSGDMAYTYGKYEATRVDKKAEGYYLRIWKKNDRDWNIVVDLRTDN